MKTKKAVRLLTKNKEHLEGIRTLSEETLGAVVSSALPIIINQLNKRSEGAAEGHRGRYGTAEEKQAKREWYQAYIDKLHTKHPDFSNNKLCEIAGKELGVSSVTIWRNTEDPTN